MSYLEDELRTDICLPNPCPKMHTETKILNSEGTSFIVPTGVIKTPILIGQELLQGSLINDLEIPEGFTEVKRVDRRVVLTQAKLVLDQLFVEGFVVKNISYVTPDPVCRPHHDHDDCIVEEDATVTRNIWKDIEVKVPFSFGTRVEDLLGYPIYIEDKVKASFQCNTAKHKCCDQGTTGKSECENLTDQFVILNQVPFAELEGYEITDYEISRKCHKGHGIYGVLTEKLLISLFIDIYVEDYVTVPAPAVAVEGEQKQQLAKPQRIMGRFIK